MRTRVWSALAALASAVPGWAAAPVRLEDLVREALTGNPAILAAQKRYEAALERPPQEHSLPDPTLSVGYASNGGPLPGQGLGNRRGRHGGCRHRGGGTDHKKLEEWERTGRKEDYREVVIGAVKEVGGPVSLPCW